MQAGTQLLPIAGTTVVSRIADIVFVHGLDGHCRLTWQHEADEESCWPLLLHNDLPTCGVWSFGYDARSSEWFHGGTMPIVDRASNFAAFLRSEGIGARPVFFIVHSLGGLIVKQMLRSCYDKDPNDPLVTQTRAVFFFATPHSGSDLSKLAQWLRFYRPTALVKELETAAAALRDLNSWYRVNCSRLKIKTTVFWETKLTKNLMVVDQLSSDPGIESAELIPVDANHVEICKIDTDSMPYKTICNSIEALTPRALIRDTSGGQEKTVAAISLGRLPVPTDPTIFVGRHSEMRTLEEAWEKGVNTVLQFVGDGGVGKSALVWQWVESLRQANYKGVVQALDWSFYSQGQHDYVTDSHEFFEEAVNHFKHMGVTFDEEIHKHADLLGREIANAFLRTGGLIVLDGVEPLQYTPDVNQGQIQDVGLAAFIRKILSAPPLAHSSPKRLLIITTRWCIPSLVGGSTKTIPVNTLPEDVAADLLARFHLVHDSSKRLYYIPPTSATDKERAVRQAFIQAGREYGGHPLAIILLASYLLYCYDGNLESRSEVPAAPEELISDPYRHAKRVMRSYDRMFATNSQKPTSRACRQVLCILGLFDRPATPSQLKAVRDGTPIVGLTDGLTDQLFGIAIEELRRLHLVAPGGSWKRDAVDTHPLVREHFGRVLQEGLPAWQEAHSRLYDHLTQSARYQPDTLPEMEPLLQAVTHGCRAGRFEETFKMYQDRILRGEGYYLWKKLGAFGPALATSAHFFEQRWKTPAPFLTDAAKADLLSEVGQYLRALARLRDAIEPTQSSLLMCVSLNDSLEATTRAFTISEILLTLGDLPQSLHYAERCCELAEQSEDYWWRMSSTAHIASVWNHLGEVAKASELFSRADQLQREYPSKKRKYKMLHSTRGFAYCQLLLDEAQRDIVSGGSRVPKLLEEIQQRASYSLGLAIEEQWLLDIAFDSLTLGHVALLEALTGRSGSWAAAERQFDEAVDRFRDSGYHDFLPLGLLGRAALRRCEGMFDKAELDLSETTEIATRGGMRLHEAEAHLEYARHFMAKCLTTSVTDNVHRAREHLDQAERLVTDMQYYRRRGDVIALRQQLDKIIGAHE